MIELLTLAGEISRLRARPFDEYTDGYAEILSEDVKQILHVLDCLENKLRLARQAMALAAAPLEAMQAGGTLKHHSKEIQDAVHDAIRRVRIALAESSLDEPLN